MTCNNCLKDFSNNYQYNKHINKKIPCKKLISNNNNNINNNINNINMDHDINMLNNQFMVGDNIELLKQISDDSIDLIYFDPPYNTGRNFFDFDDRFKTVQDYIDFITIRIKECFRCLKPSGNIIIHIEPKISHYFRFICDDIFSINNFKNEIVWQTGGNAKNLHQLNRYHDTIIVYSKKGKNKPIFNPIYFPYDDNYKKKSNVKMCDIHNKEFVTTALHNSQPDVNPRPNLRYNWNSHAKQWYVSLEKMNNLHDDNRLVYNQKGIPRIKRFLDEMDGIPLRDIWLDIHNIQLGEKMDYATQKPVKLLERIVKLYSNENNICMDIFAGSGTLGRACINLNRKYILMDINKKGQELFLHSIQ
tara:strand:+ start:1187 stop:2269 length:1083 start_codon:yes stop_codon:yes gene_type:complete